MKEVLKKYWPFLALGVAIYAVMLFFKPSIYSIPVHKQIVNGIPTEVVYVFKNDVFFDSTKCDSIVVSEGLETAVINGKKSIKVKIKAKTPLQYVQYWISGIPLYRTVIVVPKTNTANEKPYLNYLKSLVRVVTDTVSLPGLVQENFEENRIFLALEKPNPLKIFALWQNYAIKGETDGKKVKITLPREATEVGKSMVQVWVTDGKKVSHVCRILLNNGIVQTQQAEINATEQNIANQISERIQLPVVGEMPLLPQSLLSADILYVLSEPKRMTEFLYGDYRELTTSDSVRVIMFNYFGKKILFACNYSKQLKPVEFPFKGEVRNRVRETNFTIKSGRMKFNIMPQSSEWFY